MPEINTVGSESVIKIGQSYLYKNVKQMNITKKKEKNKF